MPRQDYHLAGESSRRHVHFEAEESDLYSESGRYVDFDAEESDLYSESSRQPQLDFVEFRRESDLRFEDIGTPFPPPGGPEEAMCSGARHPDDVYPSHLERRLSFGEVTISTQSNVQMGEIQAAHEEQRLPEPVTREHIRFDHMDDLDFDIYLRTLNGVIQPSRIREGLYVSKQVLPLADTQIHEAN